MLNSRKEVRHSIILGGHMLKALLRIWAQWILPYLAYGLHNRKLRLAK